jgi:MFS family permease
MRPVHRSGHDRWWPVYAGRVRRAADPAGHQHSQASFFLEQLPRAFGAFGPVLGLSAVLGPVVGGFIISAELAGLHWRPVFLINIVFGTAGLIAAAVLLPHDQPVSGGPIDGLGSGLLGLMMLAFIYGLIQGLDQRLDRDPGRQPGRRGRAVRGPRRPPAVRVPPAHQAGAAGGQGLHLRADPRPGIFFAALAGLTYLISLFFQLVQHYSADKAALALSPMAFGFITSSLAGRPLVQRLGRMLVVIGLAPAVAGALGLWATVLAEGTGVTGYLTMPSVYVLGLGIGTCITSLYDMAIGDVTQDEAGSASGSFSAVQQLASAIGAAIVTSIYFKVSAAHGGVTAMTVSSLTVAMIIVSCLGLVWLLPRRAAEG